MSACTSVAPPLLALLGAACAGPQSALDAAGPAARSIASLYWLLTAIATLVCVVVIALLVQALRRRSEGEAHAPHLPLNPQAARLQEMRRRGMGRDPSGLAAAADLEPTASDPEPLSVSLGSLDGERRILLWLALLGVGVPTLIVMATYLYTLTVHGRLAREDSGETPLTIEVIGRQWWWEVNYLNRDGERIFATANEIHVPAGIPVRFKLSGGDVIHSFWAPRLGGKMDMIPGRTTWLTLQADEPGTFRGQCAEYCAGPHAHMGFLVIAQSLDEFLAWTNRQLRGEPPLEDPAAVAGREVFLRSACVTCHTVRGTPARGTLGPDLTHLGNRVTLLGAMVPNQRGVLGGLIANPQKLKPGIHMPAVPLESEELIALLHYLENLN